MNDPANAITPAPIAPSHHPIFPQAFFTPHPAPAVQFYLDDPSIKKTVDFFLAKGLPALKLEDQREQWYDDWLAYQFTHKLYARLLAPREFSSLGSELNLLNLTRFVEVFGYCSPSHGYSFQVSFLGLFSILMGTNTALKRQAVAALEAGALFAFGVSEKNHGSDLLANQCVIRETAPGLYRANGQKYYIGNANAAAIIAILATKERQRAEHDAHRGPLVLFALRPGTAKSFQNLRKIRTLGVRAAFVGEFEIKDHELPEADIIAEGRKAWDAVFGTISLGKFFLGFGQIGICEHALEEATAHLRSRILYGSPAIQLPHLRSAMSEAYARLTAMKLFAYRALDYVQSAAPSDRRYLLYTAVQKAKVSTEGVKVMALLSECIGAKGFEADTHFEMALRDAPLIPGLEGSSHINLGLAAQFIPAYFGRPDRAALPPDSLFAGRRAAAENPFLMQATTRNLQAIRFPRCLDAFRPLRTLPNVRAFATQAARFARFVRPSKPTADLLADPEISLALGACHATIAYGQLIAENCLILNLPAAVTSVIFHLLVRDLSIAALSLATLPGLTAQQRSAIRRLLTTPAPRGADWDFIATLLA